MYRPLGLAPAAPSTIHAGRASSYADRRRAAADRLELAESLTTRLDAAVHRPGSPDSPDSPVDPHGVLRACVRALVPLAQREEGFEAVVSLGPDHVWAARLGHGLDGLVVDLVPGPGRPRGAAPEAVGDGTRVAAELADWLWAGSVGAE